jgi:histidinol-phosphatase (PHP family)
VREYIEAAIKSGIKKLGFSDHAPQFYDGGFVSFMRMEPSDAEGYVKEARSLADEYKNDIEIFVGFEAEYFPALFPKLRSFCRELGADYLIMGQHCLVSEPNNVWSSPPRTDKAVLTHYVDEVLEGLSTGTFSYLCHPDLLNYTVCDDFYRSEMTRLCVGVKELGIPLEINILGLLTGRHYPSDRFYKIAKGVGNDFILGVDAHEPHSLIEHINDPKIDEFLARNGITPLNDIALREI